MALRLYATPSPAAFPWLSAQVAITLGHTFLDLGDFAAARYRAEEARGHLTRLLTEGTLRDQLRRLSAGLARDGGHVRVPSAMALSTAEMRVLQLLPTHLSLGEIGDELHTSRNTVKTHVAAVYRKLQCSTRTRGGDTVATTSACWHPEPRRRTGGPSIPPRAVRVKSACTGRSSVRREAPAGRVADARGAGGDGDGGCVYG